jgi:chromosome segregation ATPase
MYAEKNKTFFIVIIFIIIAVCAVFVFRRSIRCIESRDSELAATRTELLETTDRLRRAEERNRKFESAVSDAADRLGELNSIFRENNGGLHSTIERLQHIAEEVEALENRLRDIDSDSGGDYTPADLCI